MTQADVAMRQQHYKEAIHLLATELKHAPNDRNLRLELGRAYLYDRQDDRALQLLKQILLEDPSDGMAKLEVARALGYRHDYTTSNQLYRELLNANTDNEPASLGLARNLMYQKRNDEARQAVEEALAYHPNSLRLQELRDRLSERPKARSLHARNSERTKNRVSAAASYLTDSAGNHSWRASQQSDNEIGHGFASRLQLDERSLWVTGGIKANVFSGTEDLRFRINRFLLLDGGGGVVRFADFSTRALYRGEIEVYPWKQLRVVGGYSRVPINPTFQATQFDLLAEGWHTRMNWNSKSWRLNGNWSREHYSDGNVGSREGAEFLRWMGSSHLAFGAGYRFNHLNFSSALPHGYFDPNTYQSHLAVAGFRLRSKRSFRGEYLARVGGESIAAGPYRIAWEASLENHAVLGNWDIGLNYSYFHIAQSTGALRAHVPRVSVAYRF
jgi:tetratricopeptide (TPR) repeat protein